MKKLFTLASDGNRLTVASDLQWFMDEVTYFHGALYIAGWAFHPSQPISEMGYILPNRPYQRLEGYGLSSPDVESRFGKAARNCRLAFPLRIDAPEDALSLKLVFTIQDGSRLSIDQFAQRCLSTDPYHLLQSRFYELLQQKESNGKVLELGSRNRSGIVRRQLVPEHLHYIGMDILSGDNVDVVGDAHALSKLFAPGTFDAIFAISVFEHLLMPWKVVLEMNRVMKIDGLVMITTHHAWPLHEMPWDFWRFSDQCWRGLFNKYTGFEIVDAAMGEPASVVSRMLHQTTLGLEQQPAYLGSAVLCRKIATTTLSWDVEPARIIDTMYPCG
ncbi:MAG TPA: class I SAM-dependent methyltransferase [Nitrososphaera sp.]|nr:class I SAM-dependent methyltransferase [Nitrososphaera sp.]